jgi:flagellin
MASVINTNSLSLLTQNNLNKSQASLNTAIQRLSSGLRINSAKDDAAGQAIANRFSSNIRGLTQAQRNANDGISMAQTTEGALSSINDNLQRIRELAVQSSNATNSDADKTSIQAEIKQRLEEINRTSDQTDFNGTKVLKSNQSLNIQVGAKDGETIRIDLKKMDATSLGVDGFNVDRSGTPNTAATDTDLRAATGWTQGTAGAVGYKSASAFVNAGTDATTGAVHYQQTVSTVTTAAAAAVPVAFTAASRGNVFGAAASAGSTVQLNGSAATLSNYSYNTTTSQFETAATAADVGDASAGGSGPTGGAASYLVPTGSGQTQATVSIGGTTQDVKIDSTGKITAADDGSDMYLDGQGNLSKTNAAGSTLAKIGGGGAGDLLQSMNHATSGSSAAAAAWTGGTITVHQASGSSVVLDAGAAGTQAESGAGVGDAITSANGGGDKWAVKESLTAADMQNKAAAGASSATIGGTTYDVAANGAVTSGGSAAFMTDAGDAAPNTLTTATGRTIAAVMEVTSSATIDYYAQTNGAVMDGSGNRVYKDSDVTNVKGFTLTDRSGNTATADPLSVLDEAIAKVDSLRSDLGAVQNRFDSVISNLGTTITNLTSSRSRIEDADYATEVSNMTRANILQQAGTSVLAQANQTTQGVLSLLR